MSSENLNPSRDELLEKRLTGPLPTVDESNVLSVAAQDDAPKIVDYGTDNTLVEPESQSETQFSFDCLEGVNAEPWHLDSKNNIGGGLQKQPDEAQLAPMKLMRCSSFGVKSNEHKSKIDFGCGPMFTEKANNKRRRTEIFRSSGDQELHRSASNESKGRLHNRDATIDQQCSTDKVQVKSILEYFGMKKSSVNTGRQFKKSDEVAPMNRNELSRTFTRSETNSITPKHKRVNSDDYVMGNMSSNLANSVPCNDNSQGEDVNFEIAIQLQKKLVIAEERIRKLEALNATLQVEVERYLTGEESHSRQVASLKFQILSLRDDVIKATERTAEKELKTRQVLETLVRALCAREGQETRQLLAANSIKIGKIIPGGSNSIKSPQAMFQYTEVWEDGLQFKAIKSKQASLIQKKDELDKRRKQVQKGMKKADKEKEQEGNISDNACVERTDTLTADELDLLEADETVKLHQMALKREEAILSDERKLLECEKQKQIKLWRRITMEDKSRFSGQPILNNRYMMMSILGKGGFSEVWKAFDLQEVREVAIKIHQLSSNWSDEKKAHYTRHARREYEIHKDMEHPRVVRLHDVFEIDNSSMATVQELCTPSDPDESQDLDQHLRVHGPLPEREAKAILTQLLSGLRYLHYPENSRPSIIHYDLKPANCLFDSSGSIKITDFGLSKIVKKEQVIGGIELTSQGAGTLWYLPPECFTVGETAPRITGKVDVWSVGVIFFQMLYGQRPFGQGQDHQKAMSEHAIVHAKQVDFPLKPLVSQEAKIFIKLCLTPSQEDRPDVKMLCAHPYVRMRR